jgi:CNT family concentrative nucleoside transporter
MLQPLLGLIALTLLAWLLSEDRSKFPWKLAFTGIASQLLLALILLKLPAAQDIFLALNRAMLAIQDATAAGTQFVFGYLGGGEPPFETRAGTSSFVLAFQALPIILLMSALSALLFHWQVLPLLVRGFSWALQRTLGIGGALGLSSAANVFVGMVEAPLLIRPYLERLSRAELFAVMTVGMATVAGTMMGLYASVLTPVLPDAMGHILTASLISAPAAVVLALILVPPRQRVTEGELRDVYTDGNAMDAITRGTLDGLRLLANIVAMLVVLVALVHLVNQFLGLLPDVAESPITLQRVLGGLMAPLMWLIGIPWAEATTAGSLMGTKTVLNEFIAYLDLAALPSSALSERSRLILTYAMCGFANLGSLGIMIGGMGAMAPSRRDEIVALGMKSIMAGTLATCMTGAVVALITF